MFGFIAFSWNKLDEPARAEARTLEQRLLTAPTAWQRVFEAPGLNVYCKGLGNGANAAHRLHNGGGVIVGALFARHRDALDESPSPLATLDEHQSEALVGSHGRELLTRFAGRYVAFLRHQTASTQWVLRDPTNNLPCFMSTQGRLAIFFSQLSDLSPLELPAWRIDQEALRTRVAAGLLRAGSTLENVSEVHGGECIELHGERPRRSFYWSPLKVAAAEPIEDPALATRMLRAIMLSSLHGWAACYPGIIVRASGGLDSSIVAGCLREAPNAPRISLFTAFMPDDPRNTLPWSRTIAAHMGVQPIEFPRRPNIDWRALARLPASPSPASDPACLEICGPEGELARTAGASAVMTGDGGDTLFGMTSARFAAREFLRRRGVRWGVLRVAENVALMRQVTVWQVLGDAFRTHFQGEPNGLEEMTRTRVLVEPEVMQAFLADRDYVPHPWYRELPLSERCWATIMRLGTLSQLPPLYNPLESDDGANVEYVLPLYDQRVVEWSLRTAAYLHIEGGRDRDLARRAFVGLVPDRILRRHWKDHPTGFLEGVVRTNLAWARELLLDGVLVKLGLLDRRRIEENLDPRALKSSMFGGELFDHVSTECWARNIQPA